MVSSNSRFQAEYAGHRLFVEQLLDPVLELIGPVLADVLEPRAIVAELGIGHRRLELGIVDAIELEREEQQMGRRAGETLLHVAVELGTDRIDRVLRVDQAGIGREPAEQVVELLETLHRARKLLAGIRAIRERGELALEILLEGDAVAVGAVEIALHRRVIDPGIERGEIPLGQFAQTFDRAFNGGFGGGGLGGFAGGAVRSCWHGGNRFAKGLCCGEAMAGQPWIRGRVASPYRIDGSPDQPQRRMEARVGRRRPDYP